jgi:hypothetical protein
MRKEDLMMKFRKNQNKEKQIPKEKKPRVYKVNPHKKVVTLNAVASRGLLSRHNRLGRLHETYGYCQGISQHESMDVWKSWN